MKNLKKKGILASVLTIALCLSLIAGSTLALFTGESKVDVAVTSGTVKVTAVASNFRTWSVTWDATAQAYAYPATANPEGTFVNGGSATTSANEIVLKKITPGDKITFDLTVTNESNVAVAYRTIVDVVADTGLFSGLKVTIDGASFSGFAMDAWTVMPTGSATYAVSVELPMEAGNEYQSTTAKLCYLVQAVQGNGVEGMGADYDTETVGGVTYITNVYTEYGLKALASAVNGGNDYLGRTVTLMNDIDLDGDALIPIGRKGAPFRGTLTAAGGTNKTIRNFTVVGKERVGLVGSLDMEGKVEYITVADATVTGNHYVGGIAGYCYGTVTNCVVSGSAITARVEGDAGSYDNGDKAGGIVGYTACAKISGNTVENTTVTAFRDLGGIAGTAAADGDVNAHVRDNEVNGVTLAYIDDDKAYGDKTNTNMDVFVGRLSGVVAVTGNVSSNTVLS